MKKKSLKRSVFCQMTHLHFYWIGSVWCLHLFDALRIEWTNLSGLHFTIETLKRAIRLWRRVKFEEPPFLSCPNKQMLKILNFIGRSLLKTPTGGVWETLKTLCLGEYGKIFAFFDKEWEKIYQISQCDTQFSFHQCHARYKLTNCKKLLWTNFHSIGFLAIKKINDMTKFTEKTQNVLQFGNLYNVQTHEFF